MNILIIGSKGFIGSHALSYYRKQGDNAYGCDVVVDYTDERYFLVDATNPNYHEPFKEIQFDVCLNCSGAASVPDSIKNPLRDFNLNTVIVFYILDAIRIYSPKCKYINLSSAAVYGNPEHLPINEFQTLKPVSPYGKHKQLAEDICKEYYDYYKIPTCCIRIFSAYGPGLRKQLFWDLHNKALKSSVIELFGTGYESRDFIYIDDLVQAIALLIRFHDFNGTAVNFANGDEVLIKDAVRIFYDNYCPDIKYKFTGNVKVGDPINWRADVSIIREMGYKQSVSIEEGLRKYIKWLKE